MIQNRFWYQSIYNIGVKILPSIRMLGILQVSKTMIAYGSILPWGKVLMKSVAAFGIVVTTAGTKNQFNLIWFSFGIGDYRPWTKILLWTELALIKSAWSRLAPKLFAPLLKFNSI